MLKVLLRVAFKDDPKMRCPKCEVILGQALSYDLLHIDELGYCEIGTHAKAGQIFQLLSQRKRSTIITSNLGFSEWATFLKDKNLTAALVDKFTANCHLINMLGCKSITPKTIPP